MARRIKPAEAAKTIADALALSHFVVANVLVVVGELTPLFDFVNSKHPGMDFVKIYIDAPAVWLLDCYWAFSQAFGFLSVFFSENARTTDTSSFTLWLGVESVILLGSVVYWGLCYIASRLILAVSQ